MRRVFAIAGLAVRTSIRSRLVVALLVILMAAIVGLPLTVQSDGTPEGYVRIVIGYTMGLAGLILSLTALWSGALSIAREVDEKQIQLVCAKPVHRAEIWLGKWLGISLVHAALLAACALATLVILQVNLGRARFTDAQRAYVQQEVLAARQVIPPQPLEIDAVVRAELQERLAGDPALPGVRPEVVLDNLRQEMLARAHTLGPGARKSWTFRLPPAGARGQPLRLQVRLATSHMETDAVRGTWLAGPPDDPNRVRVVATNRTNVRQPIDLPAEAAAGTTLVVSYLNDHPDPITVFFSPRDGLSLRVYAGPFGPNYTRAMLLILIHLMLLTALGVTASTLFSTPVAALMALAAALVLQAGDMIASLARAGSLPAGPEGPVGAGLLASVLRLLYRALDTLLAPLHTGRPLDDVATGIWISPGFVLHSILVQVLLYGGLLALLATLVFNRRELARPSA